MQSMYCPQCGSSIQGNSKADLKIKLMNHYKRKHPIVYDRNMERAKKVGKAIYVGSDVIARLLGL